MKELDTGVVAVGSDTSGNYYFAEMGGNIWILERGITIPSLYTPPTTYYVSSIIARDDESVWIYSSDTSASKGGHHLRRLWFDGVHEDIFYESTEPWIDFTVIH